jgi:hypothetical protein
MCEASHELVSPDLARRAWNSAVYGCAQFEDDEKALDRFNDAVTAAAAEEGESTRTIASTFRRRFATAWREASHSGLGKPVCAAPLRIRTIILPENLKV